ncbi:transposase family protein [Streptomyces cyaneofuscatus]|uniref:helix-turn-helix domain-containing protein n=1 Tax=Streptomyces cyaneofuscatus TaxID=66883 RepID=UPI0034215D2D
MSVGRLLATPVHLRHAATHDVLACWFDVDRSTISRAVGEVRPLLAERGCTVSQECGCGPWPRSSTTSVPTGRRGVQTVDDAPRPGWPVPWCQSGARVRAADLLLGPEGVPEGGFGLLGGPGPDGDSVPASPGSSSAAPCSSRRSSRLAA